MRAATTAWARGAMFCAALPLAALTAPASAQTPAAAATSARQTLYQRLGGYDAIAAVTDDFIQRLAQDARFARFFAGLSTDSKVRLRQHVVDQLCQVTGGPCYYTGRPMKAAHQGLGITAAEWQASAVHLTESLDAFRVPKREKDEVLAAVGTLRKDIVEK